MKLITNRISTSKARSFEDIISDYQKKNQIKTASVKTAEQEEADSSGQLNVEPLHQEGESTTMPKAGPSAKKDDGEKTSAATKPADEEGSDSGQPKAEGSEKLTNDPEVPTKEEKGGSAKSETKVARNQDGTGPDGEGPRTGRGCGPCKDKEDKEDKEKEEDEKECIASKKELPQALKDNQFKSVEDTDEDTDEEKEAKTDKEDKEEKEASKKVKFVKIANLDEKNKGFLREYWRQLFGDDYVAAIIADK